MNRMRPFLGKGVPFPWAGKRKRGVHFGQRKTTGREGPYRKRVVS